jgi:predicted DNA-binding transcriptional regulator YafY
VDVDGVYEHSVGVWQGKLIEVRVRLDGKAAKQAGEYKLNITQREMPDPDVDGAVIVTATVSGVEETARWVWRWGKEAQALAPPALVDRCAQELKAASARYS